MLLVDKVAFGYALDQPILADITFAVGGGEVLAIVGRNGAGKSTLLRLLNGLLQPAAGRISVNGNATSTTPVHRLARDIGTVFQAPEQQIFHPTVGAEIAFGPRQIGVRGAALAERVTQTLARVGLTAAAARHPLDLDAAALRFVALGSVLAMRPSILLLDEPQRGLDAGSLRRLEQIVADEAAAGTAVLLVCHDMDFVARRASRVLALAGGRIAGDRSTTAFLTDAALVQRVGVEVPDPAQLAERLGLPPQCTPATVAQAWIAQVISRRPDPTP